MVKYVDKVNLSVGEEIVEAIDALRRLFRSEQQRALGDGPHGLTHMEGRVLNLIGRKPDATQSGLAAHLGRDKGQMARLIGALRQRDLVEARPDAEDRRVQRLRLTAAGEAVQSAAQGERLRLAQRAAEGLNADERTVLAELLRRVRANLDVESPPPD